MTLARGILVLAAAACAIVPARAERLAAVVDVAVRPQTTVRYHVYQPAVSPRGAVVLFIGGDGIIPLPKAPLPAQQWVGPNSNFLMRSRGIFLQRGYTVILIDAPRGPTGSVSLFGKRSAREHREDIFRVVVDVATKLRQAASAKQDRAVREPAGLWLIGTSSAAISAANAASRWPAAPAPQPQRPTLPSLPGVTPRTTTVPLLAGVILPSPVTVGEPSGGVPETVASVSLRAITAPTLVVVNTGDTCSATPPASAAESNPAVRKTLQTKTSTQSNAGANPCGPATPHGFLGIEADTVAGMIDWMEQRLP
jgi:hypothetical protein